MTDKSNQIKKDLAVMFQTGEAKPLGDLYDLEATSLIIQSLNRKVDFYKEYKKKKTDEINDEIKKVSDKLEFLKKVVISTLASRKEKSIKFPGTCNITTRKQQHKWVIKDEEEFIKIIEEVGKPGKDGTPGENVEGVVQEVIEHHIDKKEADKLFDAWEKNGKFEELVEKLHLDDFVEKEPPKLSVSFTFEEKEDDDEQDQEQDIDVPQKANQYDGL